MSPLTQQQIDSVAAQVVQYLKPDAKPELKSKPVPVVTNDNKSIESGAGIFQTVDEAVQEAKSAFMKLNNMTLEKRKDIIHNIRNLMLEYAEDLAKKAHEETGLGRYEDKILKNKLVTEKTPGPEFLDPAAFSGDRGLTLMELAPYGVIGAITPVTNPTSTIICNAIGMLSAGNAVVFNVHPSAKNVSIYNVKLLNMAIKQAGGPENLVTAIANPTVESAQELMTHKGIRLLVVTGGAGVVKAAMTSGKRAICAGPGNPPVVIDETADIEAAARDIVRGASTDNGIICILEKEVFVVDTIADYFMDALSRNNTYILNNEQIQQLEKVIFTETRGPRKPAVMEKSLIGKNANVILSKIGVHVNDDIRLAIAPVEQDHPLVWTEQMMPVLPVVRIPNADAAIDIAIEAEHGFGHTAVMHSKNLDNLSRMAREINCSIFVKNGPSLAGLGHGGEGYCSFSIASPTGEGLTTARSFSRERRCVLVDHFRIV
jgi:acyl-CoA reductase-like NAD-dependent aldehyde dehydrogenase